MNLKSKQFQVELGLAFVLAVVTVLPFLRVLLQTGHLPIIYEPLIYDIELTSRLIARSGELPLWNPYSGIGSPVFAEPRILVAYPLALINRLFPLNTGLNIEVIIHLWLAGWGFYWLMRDLLPGSRLPALMTAVSFIFSGALIPRIEPGYIPILRVTSWIGWSLWSYRRLLLNPGLTWALVTGLIIGLELLGGNPFGIFRIALVLLLMGVVHLAKEAQQRRWRGFLITLGWSALAVFLALCLTAYKLVPAISAGSSIERFDETFSEASGRYTSIKPIHLLGIAMPLQWYDLDAQGPYAFVDFEEFTIYAGVIGLLMASLAFISPHDLRRRQARQLLGFGILGLVLALNLFGYWNLVGEVMPFMRFPSRFGLWWTVAQAILAGYGLRALLDVYASPDWDRLHKKAKWIAVALTLLTLFVFALSLLWLIEGERITALLSSRGLFGFVSADVFIHSQTYAFFSLTFALLLSAVLAWLATRRIRPDLLAGLIVAALVVEIQTFAWPLIPHETVTISPAVVERVRANLDPAVIRLEHSRAIDYGVPKVAFNRDGTELARTVDLMILDLSGGRGSQLLASGYELAASADADDPRLHPTEVDWTPPLYEYEGNLPRLYLVPSVLVVDTDEEALAYVASDAFNAYQQAVVTLDDNEPAPDLPRDAEPLLVQQAEITQYRNNSLEAVVTTDQPVMAVFAEMAYPGWHAWVDGQPAPIWRTNYTFRGVQVDAGTHTIEMKYEPVAPRVAFAISGLTALLCLSVVIIRLLRAWQAHQMD